MGTQKVRITKNKIYKTFNSDLTYKRELMIYKMNLPYVAKMISYDDDKLEIVLNKECCKSLSAVPIKEREKYYPRAKNLFIKFKKDTGVYMYDFHPGNIILNHKTDKLKLIDFEFIGSKEKTHYRKSIQSFLVKIGVIDGNRSRKKTGNKSRKKTGNRSRKKTGNRSKKKTGHRSKKKTGNRSKKKTGNRSKKKTGNRSRK